MNFSGVIEQIKKEKCAGFRYQQEGHQHYRDRITVYADGKLFFERFCYGEAACLVFSLWAPYADEQGDMKWDYSACGITDVEKQVPHRLTDIADGKLVIDDGWRHWECIDRLKTDKKNGYNALSLLIKRMTGKI